MNKAVLIEDVQIKKKYKIWRGEVQDGQLSITREWGLRPAPILVHKSVGPILNPSGLVSSLQSMFTLITPNCSTISIRDWISDSRYPSQTARIFPPIIFFVQSTAKKGPFVHSQPPQALSQPPNVFQLRSETVTPPY